MTMRWKERIAAIGCLALFCLAFMQSRTFPDIPKIIPTGVTVCGMILSAGLFARTFFIRYSDDGKEFTAEQRAGIFKVAASIAILVIYIFLLPRVGFFVTSFLFMMVFAYAADNEKHRLWTYPAVAVGLLAVIWAIFGLFLKVPLPKGILF